MAAGAVAVIGVVAVVLGTAVAAYSAYSSAQFQSATLRYNAALATQQASYQRAYGAAVSEMLRRQAAGTRALAEFDRRLQEQQAAAARTAGEIRERELRRAGERAQSKARLAIAVSGVETTGSPLDVLLDNAAAIEEEAEKLRYAISLEVYGALSGASFTELEGRLQAANLEGSAVLRQFGAEQNALGLLSEAAFGRTSARFARQTGALNVGTSILSGAGTVAYRYPSVFGGSTA